MNDNININNNKNINRNDSMGLIRTTAYIAMIPTYKIIKMN